MISIGIEVGISIFDILRTYGKNIYDNIAINQIFICIGGYVENTGAITNKPDNLAKIKMYIIMLVGVNRFKSS